jgi:hypothetical protein
MMACLLATDAAARGLDILGVQVCLGFVGFWFHGIGLKRLEERLLICEAENAAFVHYTSMFPAAASSVTHAAAAVAAAVVVV